MKKPLTCKACFTTLQKKDKVEKGHVLCPRCAKVFALKDKAQRGYVCPVHDTELEGIRSDGKTWLYCSVCDVFYVIPDERTLAIRIKESFVVEEEL